MTKYRSVEANLFWIIPTQNFANRVSSNLATLTFLFGKFLGSRKATLIGIREMLFRRHAFPDPELSPALTPDSIPETLSLKEERVC